MHDFAIVGIGVGFVVAGRSWDVVGVGLASGIVVGVGLGFLLRIQGVGRDGPPPD